MSEAGQHTVPDVASMSYEQLVEALEGLTRRMADGQAGIEESAALYEQAKRLEALARERLERVQRRIDALAEDGDEPKQPEELQEGDEAAY